MTVRRFHLKRWTQGRRLARDHSCRACDNPGLLRASSEPASGWALWLRLTVGSPCQRRYATRWPCVPSRVACETKASRCGKSLLATTGAGGHRLPCGLRDGWGGARMMGNGVRVSFPTDLRWGLRRGSAAVPPRFRADFGAVPPRFRAVPRGSASGPSRIAAWC